MAVIRIGTAQVDVVNSSLSNSELRGRNNTKKSNFVPADALTSVATTQVVTVERTIVYRKRGYRAAVQDYEYWTTTVRNDSPPSGNALIDITVVNEYLR